jgi:FkbM family methyltransferase
MLAVLKPLRWVLQHPINRGHMLGAIRRYFAWQIGSRLVPGPVAIPFADKTRLLVAPGMTGATGNIYAGLHEFEEMSFLLHALRPGDLFVDVGANVGSYTVLASGACGARSLAFEPVPSTFSHLIDNIRLNNLDALVDARNVSLGRKQGFVDITTSLDAANHVVSASEPTALSVRVPVVTLDSALGGRQPTVVKIDVEGFETEVLEGAAKTMESNSLVGLIVETNGSGARYGFDEGQLWSRLLRWGFLPVRYQPRRRLLVASSERPLKGNTLFVRSMEVLAQRIVSAPPHTVLDVSV